ncbi:MAG: TetR/AcrR family transcriptional regulator C-terminal domain-containing protein [Austwickia sp.]|jgi:AcrR family transcriptional regulator|nr:TetR/AcrR family transcriptional regulator C-terminal domain-containing protein [Austwickia sp.]
MDSRSSPTPGPTVPRSHRRGRLPAKEREAREQELLDAALRVLLREGLGGVTMGAIAAEGRASKETLYSWFGDLDGLMARLIARNADRAATPLLQALDGPPPPAAAIRPTLEDFALALIALVTSEVSVVINRAAISSPRLAHELTAFGPQRIGAVAAAYFDRLTESGIVFSARGEALFSLFFGLVVQDAQIRALLGAPRPDEAALADQAKKGVDHFLHVATRPRTLDASAYRHF